MSHPLDFLFEGQLAGQFVAAPFPSSPGVYEYEPYRSGAHYKMGQQLRERGRARCRSSVGAVKFTVIAIPEYGHLEIEEIRGT